MATGSRIRSPRTSIWLSEDPAARRKAEAGHRQRHARPQTQASAEERGQDHAAGLDRDRIIGATIRLLDAEGLARFSMRRLAAELSVTAMSVYWYVDTKDELLELALDAVNGEMRLPDPSDASEDWRAQLRQLAQEYRAMLTAHPWVPGLIGQYLNIGPGAIAFSQATLGVIKRSGLPEEERSGALAAVFQFVYGFATIECLFTARCREAGIGIEDYVHGVMQAVESRPELHQAMAESYPAAGAAGATSVHERRERDFAFAMDTVIAGIETMRDRASAPDGASPGQRPSLGDRAG